ncbi:MAG: type II toxin-antitoxin system RelE/ParE family toxin [Gammaproteobacteria bacterium]|nr:type II toxin-antitoxin system RelE/ParE family toxin [Gammaproteobacteria bacterium]
MTTSSEGKSRTPYTLEFAEAAKKEWDNLDPIIRKQFATKLKERLVQPEVAADRLSGMPGCYKIKQRASGFRLVYEVINDRVVVLVLAVGKRERKKVYAAAAKRLNS